MTKEDNIQLQAMKKFSNRFQDEPDGVFFALAQDTYGWTIDDWVWYKENE